MKPTLGTPSTPGRSTVQFGQSGFGSMGSKPVFGQSSFGQPSTPGSGTFAGGGFSSFANSGGGFASFASAKPMENLFAKAPAESPFSKLSGQSGFGNLQNDTNTAFTKKTNEPAGVGFGSQGGFNLGSTFKGDGTAVNDAPKPDKPSGMFSLGGDIDEMVSSPTKPSSPPAPEEAMDSMEDESTGPPQPPPAPKEPAPSMFGPSKREPPQPQPPPFGGQLKTEQPPTPAPAEPEKPQVLEKPPVEKEKEKQKPEEQPVPPDSTSKAVFGPGDTPASSNVSRSSAEETPLPPDFTAKPSPVSKPVEEAPLHPDFAAKPEPEAVPKPAEETPLPPDTVKTAKETEKTKETDAKAEAEETKEPQKAVEDVPLPPEEKESEDEAEGSEAEAEEEDAEDEESQVEAGEFEETGEFEEEANDSQVESESAFTDSGEDITNEFSPTDEGLEAKVHSFKTSSGSSIGTPADKSGAVELSSRISKPGEKEEQGVPRSPSPVPKSERRRRTKPEVSKPKKVSTPPGKTLAARKATLKESAQRQGRLEPLPSDVAKEGQARYVAQAQRQAEEETLPLSDDDEDEKLRADLAQPLEPVPTLDPFLPHQDYTGGTSKPGIPGQIERLYRDINSMVDTLGMNSRSLLSYFLYQQSPEDSDYERWTEILHGDQPTDIVDAKLRFIDIEKLDDFVDGLYASLDQRRIQGVEEKLNQCREILSKDILTLRGQCAGIRKTLDAHTNAASVLSAPLSAEQVNLQQDLRSASMDAQTKLAGLEQGISLLRAKIADAIRHDGTKPTTKRPTAEAVASTISTMMSMAENKSSDIDVLEAQMRRLGVDVSSEPPLLPPGSVRDGSPFATPRKTMLGRLPATPGSRGSDGPVTAYHTPDSAGRGGGFRASVNGSARVSRLRDVEGVESPMVKQESQRWKAKAQRRRQVVGDLKQALEQKESKVRGVDDP